MMRLASATSLRRRSSARMIVEQDCRRGWRERPVLIRIKERNAPWTNCQRNSDAPELLCRHGAPAFYGHRTSIFTMTRSEFLRFIVGATSLWTTSGIVRANPTISEKMHTRPIPSTGEALPVVGCGTWRTFDVGQSPAERALLIEVLQILFENSGSVIDSSPMYGAAEAVVGDLLTTMKARSKAFIATKVWTRGREAGIEQMRHSMKL